MNGIPFEIITEGKIPKHFEKRMVPGGAAHVFKIVMLSRHPHALLCGSRTGIAPSFVSQEHLFELDHPGIGEEKGGIVLG
jgi:hypothetical protein